MVSKILLTAVALATPAFTRNAPTKMTLTGHRQRRHTKTAAPADIFKDRMVKSVVDTGRRAVASISKELVAITADPHGHAGGHEAAGTAHHGVNSFWYLQLGQTLSWSPRNLEWLRTWSLYYTWAVMGMLFVYHFNAFGIDLEDFFGFGKEQLDVFHVIEVSLHLFTTLMQFF